MWKYCTGNSSAALAAIHLARAFPWHRGQCLFRHELFGPCSWHCYDAGVVQHQLPELRHSNLLVTHTLHREIMLGDDHALASAALAASFKRRSQLRRGPESHFGKPEWTEIALPEFRFLNV